MNHYDDIQLMVLEKPTISCEDVDLMLGDYIEGDLPESLAQRMEEHIAECSDCQEGVARYKEVIELAGELGEKPKPIPESVSKNLRKALNEKLGLTLRT